MIRYWAVVGVVLASFMAGFALVEALQLSVLSDPSRALRLGGALAAALYGPALGMLLSLFSAGWGWAW